MANYERGTQPTPSDQEPRRTLEGRVSLEILGKYHLFLTQDCPPEVAAVFAGLQTEADVAAFVSGLRQLRTPSRRSVFHSPAFSENAGAIPILKQKAKKPNDPEYPGLDIEMFTTNPFHEMETTYSLEEILRRRAADIPSVLSLESRDYQLEFVVQKPWGALVNSSDQSQKFGIFEYIPGTSVRSEAASYGMWNDVPEELRKLYGRMHTTLDKVAAVCVEEGLEPWDLGIHQVIYRKDDATKHITLGIVDTEEFNFAADGQHWPDTFSRTGLPPILLLSMLFSSNDFYED